MRDPADWLRLLAAAAALAAAAVFFYAPLEATLEGWLGGSLQNPLAEINAPEAATRPVPATLLLQVLSKPPAARVTVDGGDRGLTPAVVNVACTEGAIVTVVVSRDGFKPWQSQVECLPGKTLTLEATLLR